LLKNESLGRNERVNRPKELIIIAVLISLCATQIVFADTDPIESFIPKVAPEGWDLREAPETFTRETLFEHIDGQADLFVRYGFDKSVFAIYRKLDTSADKIDVDIYDMGNSLQAFGVFSRFRQDESPANIGLDSYMSDRYALFYKGKYFVILQATESNPSALKRLALDIESLILDSSAPPQEIGYFPKSGLKPGSIEYFPDGLLGHQFLKRGFKASYVENGEQKIEPQETSRIKDFRLFLAMFKSPQEAIGALKLFKENLLKKGKLAKTASARFGPEIVIGTDPYQGKTIVAQKGPCLLGAVGFAQDEAGERLLAALMREVK